MKKILITLLIMVTMLVNPANIKAASATISVSNSRTSLIVGNSLTTTVTVSSATNLGAWSFDLKYDSTKLRLTGSSFGGGTYIADVVTSPNQKSAKYTFTFTAIKSGTTSVYVANSEVIAYDESSMGVTNGSRSVTIMTQAELEATYSKNNYLSSLGVAGATIAPVFNKDTLEYSVELVPDTTSATITATLEDAKSTISGTGAVTVTDGDNRMEIKVSAQNGAQRTYVLVIKVKEYNPIEVTVDGKKLTVVRKKSSLTAPNNYVETTTKIGTEDVIAFTNETTGYILVGLKDAEGVVNYYIYDSKANTYTLYQELLFNSIVFFPITFPKGEIPAGYHQATIKYNDKSLVVYQYQSDSTYALIYGMNVATGDKHLYMFDSVENTLQIYNSEETNALRKSNNQYLLMLILTGIVTALLLVGYVILGTIKYKKGKKSNHKMEDKLKNFKLKTPNDKLIDLSKESE